ncbi:MAG TPA: AAA family ATPase, partial [Thermoleophilaceae bacterium]|nr:AAA family ATPase [Thermoleophilaceae bacterium]
MAAIVGADTSADMSNGYSSDERAQAAGYSAATTLAVEQTARMPWPLTGREAELELVEEALSGESVGGVVIAGAAGVGKTRLTAAGAELAQRSGCVVEWARASSSARSIPLGAFASLLPAGDRLPQGVELLARARQVLAERAGERRLVLCVDDGQLLDDASAALVHQLVAAGEAFVLVSLRPDEPVADALRALWKDELCLRVELGGLARGEMRALLEAALGGPVDGTSHSALWSLTRGNALFLRELVRHGLDRGLLSEVGGVWRWRGELEAGTRLAELVDMRIEEVGPSAGRVLEALAVGGPLEVGLLEPGELAGLEELERRELVQRHTDRRRRFVDVAHPLHGEAVRAQL